MAANAHAHFKTTPTNLHLWIKLAKYWVAVLVKQYIKLEWPKDRNSSSEVRLSKFMAPKSYFNTNSIKYSEIRIPNTASYIPHPKSDFQNRLHTSRAICMPWQSLWTLVSSPDPALNSAGRNCVDRMAPTLDDNYILASSPCMPLPFQLYRSLMIINLQQFISIYSTL